MHPLRGTFSVLVLYDVAEQIDLDRLRAIRGSQPPVREPAFKHPVPEYVRFERPPFVEFPAPVCIAPGEQFTTRLRYFAYGVVSVELELAFEFGWDDLIRLTSRFVAEPEIEKSTLDLVRAKLQELTPALVQPYASWLSEEYCIINLREALDDHSQPLTAATLLEKHGEDITRIVRGEAVPLSQAECADALQASMSYYPTDLLVVGWVAAFIYDNEEGADSTIQLLEYANSQLLEFRHYDDVLTRILENVYNSMERGGGLFRNWRYTRQAARLNAVRLEVTDLTERTDNALKFVGDMFYARAYRMAAARVGVTDYRNLVERKLRIAADLYESMVNEYHQARSFVLEALVVLILVIELIHLFRGTF